MILNKHNFPCLYDDGSIEYGQYPRVLRHNYKFNNDKAYFYLEILYTYRAGVQPIKRLETCIPIDVLNLIKNGNIYLLVLGIEYISDIAEDVYRFIKENNIPENKVEIVTELIDIRDILSTISKKYNLDLIKSYYINIDEFGLVNDLVKNIDSYKNFKPLSNKKFDKSFINFNRRWRIHRPLFVSMLACKNLLDKGYVSLGDINENGSNWVDCYTSMLNISDDEYKNILLENKDMILNLPQLEIDTDRFDVNLCYLDMFDSTKEFYSQTYFSVISETCFFEDVGRFITEKTFKAIAHHHPFLMLGPPNTLEFLHSRGYQTFHPYINESYDQITDNITRFKRVLDETERLVNLTQGELESFINGVSTIVDHNFNILVSRNVNDFIVETG